MIDIKGLDKAEVLSALNNAANLLHGKLSIAQAQELMETEQEKNYEKNLGIDLSTDELYPAMYNNYFGKNKAETCSGAQTPLRQRRVTTRTIHLPWEPAIWMLPTDDKYGIWASSGEIDIMEFKGQEPNVVWGTLHYGSPWPGNTHTGETYKLEKGNFTDDFHTYAIQWEEGIIRWYIDDKLWQTQTKWDSDGGKFPAPFDERFHLLLNLAVGGQFVGNPDRSTAFPATMLVDYVRVYQK